MVGVRQWLLRRDAGLLAVRRATRVATVACTGFYSCRYLVDNPVMALYALFAAVALGFLSQIPGSAAQRSVTLLWSTPVLTVPRPPQSVDDPSVAALARAREAKELANASYGMYQTERHAVPESTVDWQAVMATGYHIVRGSELLHDTCEPGSLQAWLAGVADDLTRISSSPT